VEPAKGFRLLIQKQSELLGQKCKGNTKTNPFLIRGKAGQTTFIAHATEFVLPISPLTEPSWL
jgi:hypothetical protein